jgi:hypothetical protein
MSNFDVAYPKASKFLFVLDGFSVSLSALLLEAVLHDALGVLNDGGLDLDFRRWDDRIPTQGVFARAELVDLVEDEYVANLDVAEMRDGEEVARRKDVVAAGECSDDILGGLRTDELKRGGR